MTRFKLFYFAATQAGDWHPASRGHKIALRYAGGSRVEEWVLTGHNAHKREVYISRDNAHRVVTGASELFDSCSLKFATAADKPAA